MRDANEPRRYTLRELREERGISREQLAVDLKIAFATVVNLERGRNKPRVDLAERIYAYFGVPFGSIQWGARPEAKPRPKKAA